MVLRASARPFVPVATAHVVESATATVSPEALGDQLIQDLATRIDSLKSSNRRTEVKGNVRLLRRDSRTAPLAKPAGQGRRISNSWCKLPASGLFCPCCATLRSCPFHMVDSDVNLLPETCADDADLRLKSFSRQSVLLRQTREDVCNQEAASRLRLKRDLPPPPTEAPPPPPTLPPPPPGLELEKRVADAKLCASRKDDRSAEGANLPSWLLDDASTDVSHADSEVSSAVSLRSSRTRRSTTFRENNVVRSNWGKSGKEMEWLPYRSAVWPNSGPRLRV